MEYVQKAIELAIEGGYIPKQYLKASQAVQDDWKKKGLVMKEQALLEPLFWQSLGKQLGFEKDDKETEALYRKAGGAEMMIGLYKWHKTWHKFINHIAKEKPANDFFKTLLE